MWAMQPSRRGPPDATAGVQSRPSNLSAIFEANCPDALPLAVQALEACQYAADFERVEHYLEGLRKERYRARDEVKGLLIF